jgi:hypothetical protein
MHTKGFRWLVLLVLLLPAVASAATLIPTSAAWRYDASGSDWGAAWHDPAFDDSTWPAGSAQLGFGDGDESTVIAQRPVTVYFRHAFELAAPLEGGVLLRLLRDDGAVVYVNGLEVFRSNMPVGPVSYNTLANAAVSGAEESTLFVEAMLSPEVFVAGRNVVAVEVHQVNATSSDLSLALELIHETPAVTNQPPVISILSPTNGTVRPFGTPLTLEATASDPQDGYAVSVAFYRGSNYLGAGTFQNSACPAPWCPSFVFVWSNAPVGTHVITARAMDSGGATTVSAPVTVTIQSTNPPVQAPVIVRQPMDRSGAVGGAVAFSVEATGTAPLHYRWRHEGRTVASGYVPSLVLSNVQPTNAGWYNVTITNIAGLVVSSNAYLNVVRPTNGTLIHLSFDPPSLPRGSMHRSSYTESGFTFWTSNGLAHTDSASSSAVPSNGTAFLQFLANQAPMLITRPGGGTFDLWSVDLAEYSTVFPQPKAVTFRGTRADSSVVFQTFTTDGVIDGPGTLEDFQTFHFNVGFTNLVRVEVLQPLFSMDNLVVQHFGNVNQQPTVNILQPTNGATVSAGNSLELRAVAADPDGQVTEVRFRAGDLVLHASEDFPPNGQWSAMWSNVPAGAHSITAIAYDQMASVGTSAPVNVTAIGTNPPVFPRISVLASQPDVSESPTNGAGRFTLVRSGNVSSPLTVHFNISGTAANGTDYFMITNRAVFLPGQSNRHVVVSPINDFEVEAPETVILTLLPTTNAAAYDIESPTSATVTIADDDSLGFGSVTFVSTGAVWRYLDNGLDPSSAWFLPAYNDSAWFIGPAQLGYGDGDEATVVSSGGNPTMPNITTYFRHSFHLDHAAAYSNVIVRLLRDDGGVVYINGVEVFRSNMPTGTVNHYTLASTAVGGGDESTNFHSASVPYGVLVNGENVVAVEIHQGTPASSDMSFDLELTGLGPIPIPRQNVVSVVASDAHARELGGGSVDLGQFQIRRTGPLNFPLTVSFQLSGTAVQGTDYAFLPSSLVIPAGATQAVVNITPLADDLLEGSEDVTLTILPPVCAAVVPPPPGCYAVGVPSQATVVITDYVVTNPVPALSILRPTNGASFSAGSSIVIEAEAADAQATVDLFANNLFIGRAFPSPLACLTTPCVTHALVWSNVVAGSFVLEARSTNVFGLTLTSAPVHITVVGGSNLARPRILANPQSVTIPVGGTASFTVVATGAPPLTYRWLRNGTQFASNSSPTLTLSNVQPSLQGVFRVMVVNAFGTAISSNFTLTVTNVVQPEDTVVHVTAVDPQASEPGILTVMDSGRFAIHRRGNLDVEVPVYFTLGGSAQNGTDYLFVTNQVIIPAGSTQATVTIYPRADGLLEGTENVVLTLNPIFCLVPGPECYVIGSPDSATVFINDGPVISNQPPVVNWISPSNGSVYPAGTNVLLRVAATDPDGSNTLRAVQFYAGTNLLGVRSNGFNWPLRAELMWSNVPAGAHTLRAVGIDQAGARGTSAPVTVRVIAPPNPVPEELHVVGIYSGLFNGGSSPNHERGDAQVFVDRPGSTVTLYLSAYEPVRWHVTVSENTILRRVFLAGYYDQEVTSLPAGTTVHRTSHYLGYTLDCARFYLGLPAVRQLTGLEISSFQGAYVPTAPFVIDNVQQDERLRSDYPRSTPASQLPTNLNFALWFHQLGDGGRVTPLGYSLAGPVGGGAVLPGMRVFRAPSNARYFYGVNWHEVWRVDTQADTATMMHLPPGLPEFSWTSSATYDTTRNRFLVVSFGGEGFLYAYSPETDDWSVVRSMEHHDLSAIAYHAATDELFGLSMMFTECGQPLLYRMTADGQVVGQLPLPIIPFAPYGARASLVSVGEYLVLLMQGDAGSNPSESRIYLIDPRSGQTWLTYRSGGGSPDDDLDGVPNSRDACPGTPHNVPVDSQGCPMALADADRDGVSDNADRCPSTPAGAPVDGNGCSIPQICPCDGPWKNHGEYVSCVDSALDEFLEHGWITEEQRREMHRAAAQSECGKKIVIKRETAPEASLGGTRLVIDPGTAAQCIVEYSTNLLNWLPLCTNVCNGTKFELNDKSGPAGAMKFYRIRTE